MELVTGETSGVVTAQTSGLLSGGMTGETTARTTGGMDESGEWIPAAEAAQRLGVSVRTVRRWVATARVVGKIVGDPGHEVRYVRTDTLPPLSGEVIDAAGDRGDDRRDVRADGRGHGHADTLSPDTPDDWADRAGSGADTCRCCRVRAEELQHLRSQLDVRAQELERRDVAEAELRRLLMASQQLAAQLGDQLAQKSLPAPDPEPARRVRWWSLWRRG
jgi:hypothetical protein